MPVDVDLKPLLCRMYALNLRRADVARLSGVSAADLSLAASGQKDLPYPKFALVRNLIAACEEAVCRAGAILDWRDTTGVRRVLERFEQEKAARAFIPKVDEEPKVATEVNLMEVTNK